MSGSAKILALALAATLAAQAAPAQHSHIADASTAAASLKHGSPFARGLYLLHNFEYSSAAEAFREAQKSDPANVMAYWGEAMTYNHPLWAEQDVEAARAVLERLGPSAAARRAKARSAREAMWLASVEALFGDGTKVDRDRAYHERMKALFDADPNDVDARSFYALATLGLAHGGRDTALYMRAAALLEEAFPSHPGHPGVLHYLIHSYDDPAHAPLGERAAALYAKVAPDAGHAQHMVSHIYLALGRWEEVERANSTAMAVVNGQRSAEGLPPARCGHYNEWLIYALDQQGKDSREATDGCRAEAMAALASASDKSKLGGTRNLFNNWATIAVRHGVDTGRWPDWSTIPNGDWPALGRFELAYGRLLASRRDPIAAASALAEMKQLKDRIVAAMPAERPDDHQSAPWFDRAVAQGEAVLALAKGDHDRALSLLRQAAEAEAALPQPFGPPVLAKPSYELLGDELLAMRKKADAEAAYRQSLAAAPNRRLSVVGLGEAAGQALASASSKH